jgi:hypothetical protein
MKQLAALTGLFLLLSVFAFKIESAKDRMQSFEWLPGNWMMATNKGAITESWKTGKKNERNGLSDFLRKDGILEPLEIIQSVYRKKHYYYIAKAAGQNNDEPVEFKITAYNHSGFVTENPLHDYPKRITYRMIHTDSIRAVIDDGLEKPLKQSAYYYSRRK